MVSFRASNDGAAEYSMIASHASPFRQGERVYFKSTSFHVRNNMHVYSFGSGLLAHSSQPLLSNNCSCRSYKHKHSLSPKCSFSFLVPSLLAFPLLFHCLHLFLLPFLLLSHQCCFLSSISPLSATLFISSDDLLSPGFSRAGDAISAFFS